MDHEHCSEVAEKLGLSELRGRQWFVQPTSATKGSHTAINVIRDIYAFCVHQVLASGRAWTGCPKPWYPIEDYTTCKFCSFRTSFAHCCRAFLSRVKHA